MGDKTGIEWTDATWNPIVGCSRVSPGCDNCYAIPQAERIVLMGGKGGAKYEGTVEGRSGDWTGLVKFDHPTLDQPLRWKKPRRIFVNSMSDLFHPDVDYGVIAGIFGIMAQAQRHTFQILTKRPSIMANIVGDDSGAMSFENVVYSAWQTATEYDPTRDPWPGWPLPNVWLGTSIESNAYAFRANALRDTPAAVRWVSAEPLLGSLDRLDLTDIDWVVAGGESGPNSRPMHPDWPRELREKCLRPCQPCGGTGSISVYEGGVFTGARACECQYESPPLPAFHFKQWGNWRPTDTYDITKRIVTMGPPDQMMEYHRSKKSAGRELDGRTWDEYPASHKADS